MCSQIRPNQHTIRWRQGAISDAALAAMITWVERNFVAHSYMVLTKDNKPANPISPFPNHESKHSSATRSNSTFSSSHTGMGLWTMLSDESWGFRLVLAPDHRNPTSHHSDGQMTAEHLLSRICDLSPPHRLFDKSMLHVLIGRR